MGFLLFKVADNDGQGQGHGQGPTDGTECSHKLAQAADWVNVSITELKEIRNNEGMS